MKKLLLIVAIPALVLCAGLWFYFVYCGYRPDEKTVQRYENGDQAAKQDILNRLIISRSKSDKATFFALLGKTSESEIDLFDSSFKTYGNCQTLVDLSKHVSFIVSFYREKAEIAIGHEIDPENITQDEKKKVDSLQDEMRKTVDSFIVRLGAMKETFLKLSRDNTQCLVSSMNNAYEADVDSELTILSTILMLQEEDGFEAVIKNLKSKKDEEMAFQVMEKFPEAAIIPCLKAYERQDTTPQVRDFVSTMIFGLPDDNQKVFKKIAQAYRHGRFYELPAKVSKEPKKTVGISELPSILSQFDQAYDTWWGNVLQYKFRDNPLLGHYLGIVELPEKEGQDKIISLLTSVNFEVGKFYLKNLSYEKLSPKAREELLFSLHPPQSEAEIKYEGKPLFNERFDLFMHIFDQMTPEERREKKMVFRIEGYPEDIQEKFLTLNFPVFTDEDKGSALFVCSKLSTERKNRIYGLVQPFCNQKLKGMIDYYKGKHQTDRFF